MDDLSKAGVQQNAIIMGVTFAITAYQISSERQTIEVRGCSLIDRALRMFNYILHW